MGHVLGRIIVKAENEEDAFDLADDTLMTIAGEGRDYDSGSTLRESDAYCRNETEEPIIEVCTKFGSDACDKCKTRFKCYTHDTLSVVRAEMDKMKQAFIGNFKNLKKQMRGKTAEELFDDAEFRYLCSDCGRHDGYSSVLYDEDGSCIVSTKELEDALKPQEGLKVYVIAVSLHY